MQKALCDVDVEVFEIIMRESLEEGAKRKCRVRVTFISRQRSVPTLPFDLTSQPRPHLTSSSFCQTLCVMAQSEQPTSFQTEATINVSQNAVSSPLRSNDVQVEYSIVEDSMKGIAGARPVGAVRSPPPVPLERESDPSNSATAQGAQASNHSGVSDGESQEAKLASHPHPVGDSNAVQQPVEPVSRPNAVDALLTNGATVHQSTTKKRRDSLARTRNDNALSM